MRKTLLFLGFAVGLGFACSSDAGAVPIGGEGYERSGGRRSSA